MRIKYAPLINKFVDFNYRGYSFVQTCLSFTDHDRLRPWGVIMGLFSGCHKGCFFRGLVLLETAHLPRVHLIFIVRSVCTIDIIVMGWVENFIYILFCGSRGLNVFSAFRLMQWNLNKSCLGNLLLPASVNCTYLTNVSTFISNFCYFFSFH